jgi:flagellar hook-associated protein 3 FlgL
MTRISSYTAFLSGMGGILDGQSKMNTAQAQASSEKVAQDLKGYGHEAKKLVDSRAIISRIESRNEDLKNLAARATVEETAFTSFTDAVDDARSAFNNAIAQQNGAGLDAAIEGALNAIMSAANVEFAGQAIFGGINSYENPVINADLDTLALQPNTDTNFKDMGANRVIALDDGRSIELSKSAKEIFQPFVDFLRSVRVYENANGKFSGKLNDTQANWLKSQMASLETIQNDAISQAGDAGVRFKEIEDTIERNNAKLTRMNEVVGDIQNVDLAEVAAKLSAAQTQYQASAAIFAQLKDLNLLQYLR